MPEPGVGTTCKNKKPGVLLILRNDREQNILETHLGQRDACQVEFSVRIDEECGFPDSIKQFFSEFFSRPARSAIWFGVDL
jgi:hypothetical protein